MGVYHGNADALSQKVSEHRMAYPHQSWPEFRTESLLSGRLVRPVRTFCCLPSDKKRGLPLRKPGGSAGVLLPGTHTCSKGLV